MTIDKTVLVPLDADETFALLTEPERLRRWQLVSARMDLRAGGDFRWTVLPGANASGTFVEVEPGKRLVYTWGWETERTEMGPEPGASTITITLEPAEGGTTVRLVHEGLTPEQDEAHSHGWDHFLGRLVAASKDGGCRGLEVGHRTLPGEGPVSETNRWRHGSPANRQLARGP